MKLCACCTFELITEYIKSYWKAVPAAGVPVTGNSDRALGMKCQSGNVIPSSSIFYCHIPSTVWNICSYLFIEPLGLTYPKSCLTSWNCHFKGSFLPHSAENVASHSVVFDFLQSHGQQHTRLPCPSLSLGICSNSCPLSQWCHPTMSSAVIPSPLPASGSFPMGQLFTSGGQSIRASASASVLPVNIQGWFPLRLMVWSPCCLC